MREAYAWIFLPTDADLAAASSAPATGAPGYKQPTIGEIRYRLGGWPALSDPKVAQPGWRRAPLLDTWVDRS